MPCYFPLQAYYSAPDRRTGDRGIFFSEQAAGRDCEPLRIRCGQCIGCRLSRARDWTARMVHESSLYEDNCFLTLTYSEENLPSDMGLDVRPLQLFWKKLRKATRPSKLRYFACGEYGDLYKRPHYHANVFGWFPPDAIPLPSKRKYPLYRSQIVEDCWGLGNCWIGRFEAGTASYVAGYIVKKLNGDFSKLYEGRKPEFGVMSRRPGIGARWFEQFSSDVYSPNRDTNYVVLKGKPIRPPRYYDRLLEAVDPDLLEQVKEYRVPTDPKVRAESGADRLAVKAKVALSRLSQFKREEL